MIVGIKTELILYACLHQAPLAQRTIMAAKAKATKPRTKKRANSFKTYISRVLKQVHPKIGLSKKSMIIMNSFVMDSFDKIAQESAKLAKTSKRATLSAREVQSAVRLVLPNELAKHAVTEGTKAIQKFNA